MVVPEETTVLIHIATVILSCIAHLQAALSVWALYSYKLQNKPNEERNEKRCKMVKLGKNGFVVEVQSNQPANDYVETVNDLLKLLRNRDPEMSDENSFYTIELIRGMLPTVDQAAVMLKEVATEA